MVKIEDVSAGTEDLVSYASIVEKIEIMRSAMRWANSLERKQIEALLVQCLGIRDDVLRLSHAQRFIEASHQSPNNDPATPVSALARREQLVNRDFVFEGVFGENPKLLEAFEVAEKAAPTNLPVLIYGESGTGKELMAKVLHTNGSRSEQPYVSVNCGAIPENLIESELFGHVRGAFTGASSNRAGRFESANTGTIFLDEIGELPLTGQVKLLRVLQSREIQRVGSDEPIQVDTRVVAATNRDLRAMCAEGTFREDLYYRLSVINVTLPPLRERRDEIDLLVQFFADEAAGELRRAPIRLSESLHDKMLSYDYPGNIRELRNLIFRLSCLAGEMATTEHLPEEVMIPTESAEILDTDDADFAATRPFDQEAQSVPDGSPDVASLSGFKRAAADRAEREFLKRGLQDTQGNVTELARRIELNRTHVQTLLKKHEIQSKSFKPTAR